MSSATATLGPSLAGRDIRPGLVRLTIVELRKMVDTRAGLWLQLSVFALTIGLVFARLFVGGDVDHELTDFLALVVQPSAVLLPVVGILLVSSEWSQRTSLVTFTLVPHRGRVLAAKLGAAVALSVAAFVLSLAASVAGTALAAPGVEGTWSLPPELLGQIALYLATSMITGVAYGAALLSSAPAIALYFVLPLAWSFLGFIPALETAARWLDQSRTLLPMLEHVLSATEWAHVGTSLALWMALPLLIGVWRIVRSEVR